MLNLLRRDADPEALEEVAKRDPGVAVKLIEIANSPMAGLARPVASLQQAFLILGRDALYRWLSLGIFRAGGDPRDETLLELALNRARFLELIAQRCNARADELFLVGLFSLLDSLLGIPMTEVVGRMQLPAAVSQVLLRSEGPYGQFLRLALLAERGRDEQIVQIAGSIGVEADEIAVCRCVAFLWTQESLGSR
jgi:EAL and modified HD-GYP domain-containing signal transduction protein